MAKAFLMIDMLERCNDCEFSNMSDAGKWYCERKIKAIQDLNSRPDWCPLIPEPPQATPDNSDMSIEWNMGWNACLDALEGKENV